MGDLILYKFVCGQELHFDSDFAKRITPYDRRVEKELEKWLKSIPNSLENEVNSRNLFIKNYIDKNYKRIKKFD